MKKSIKKYQGGGTTQTTTVPFKKPATKNPSFEMSRAPMSPTKKSSVPKPTSSMFTNTSKPSMKKGGSVKSKKK